jgi:hypothetical protein
MKRIKPASGFDDLLRELDHLETKSEQLEWDDIKTTESYRQGIILAPEEQFRNQFTTREAQLRNLGQLFNRVPRIKMRRQTGKSDQNETASVIHIHTEDDAEGDYVYEITKGAIAYEIMWDELAARYGFDVDLGKYNDLAYFDEELLGGNILSEQIMYAWHRVTDLLVEAKYPIAMMSDSRQEQIVFFPHAGKRFATLIQGEAEEKEKNEELPK